LLTYVADLELEVDRLRKQSQFVQQEASHAVQQIQLLCAGSPQPESVPDRLAEIERTVAQLAAVVRDVREPPGYHPAYDQVIAIAVRPLIEQVFRWQQRLLNAPHTVLRLELESEHMEWFPTRLRHILDNLISNAVAYRDISKGETRLTLGLRVLPNGYELRVSDNGMGIPLTQSTDRTERFHRSAPVRAAGPGVGLAVVKLLVEHSGGTLTTEYSGELGSTFIAVLPRYDVDDFLESASAASPSTQ
jgi:signal transduction histidine kinase